MDTALASASEAARTVGISASHLRALAAERRVPHLAIPGTGERCRYVFDVDELVQFFRRTPENVQIRHKALTAPPARPKRRVLDRDPDWDSISK